MANLTEYVHSLWKLFTRRRKSTLSSSKDNKQIITQENQECRIIDMYDVLMDKWNLHEYQMQKSQCFDYLKTLSDERKYGEVLPERVIRIMPLSLILVLINSDFMLRYSNSAPGNKYDVRKNIAIFKTTDDLIHEIGHGLWYNLISPDESDKKEAVINALSEDHTYRETLSDDQIPTIHKEYAGLVNAYSGQFLRKFHISDRVNDLEEHFARNFDYLIKGKPLHALPLSDSTIDDFMAYYSQLGIIKGHFRNYSA